MLKIIMVHLNRRIFICFVVLFADILCGMGLKGQTILFSTITGTVLDHQTQAPLPGATIIVPDTDPVIGTVADSSGHFRIPRVKIGQYQLKVTYIGYSPVITDPLIVTTGKETMTVIFMDETALNVPEVEIRAGYRKNEAINKMATVSVRSFSVDETFRFAGSYNDPARMAANFAGVTSGIDNRNDIIVRGNSPIGMQWRIDDMEIPNPNHFATVGTTGGPVTILNNNLLTNSDFFTGAFPAQYGNTLAGIFDLKMRNGNTEKREYWFEIGWNGLEFGAEGPFSKKSRASYLISYRYSPLQFLNWFGINTGIVPKYQDLNLKINIPTKKAGTFTITGIGGLSFIELFDSRKSQENWLFPDYGEDLSNGSDLGVLGLTHQIFFQKDLQWKNMLYAVASGTRTKIDTFSFIHQNPSSWAGERSSEIKYSFSSQLTKKINAKNVLNTGIFFDYYQMAFADSMMYENSFLVNTGSREQMQMARGFVQWQHAFNDVLSATTGLFGSWLSLNNSWSLEPRMGFDWNFNKKHSINFGAGLYSQIQPHVIYFVLSRLPDGSLLQPNRQLDNTRSAEIALGYNYQLTENLRFKTEIYYQYLWDIPVKQAIPQYALSNQGHDFFLDRQYADSLINKGKGYNYGIECTFERFFKKHYFFLFTASLFNSTYQGYDQIIRNSAFNVNYALNAAGGYEFIIGKRQWGTMSFGLRATWAGGNPYIPYNVNTTMLTAEPVYDWDQGYNPRYPEYKRISFRFGIKRNLPGYNIEFLLDLQYRTNYTNVSLQRIDPETGEIRYFFTMGFFPMGTWRIQF
ncbi:MAG: carboxypeptidase-like regulatory domain-containing protein [Bacteroidales bacterium]|nr:carboxypeptidase-like regulatory domain-containing protein [Bacteroidales bacterium]